MRELFQKPLVRALFAVGGIAAAAIAWWLVSPLFLDSTVDEAFPEVAVAESATTTTTVQAAPTTTDPAGTQSTTTTTAPEAMDEPTGPVALSVGSFEDIDATHRGSGTATIYELEDGSRVLRLEDFEVTNGPDLHVLLVPHPDPSGRDDVTGYLDLGELKGNIGSQNYEIPDDVDLSEYGSVVIYCVPFHVLFSTASLTPQG